MTVLFIRENVDNYGWPLRRLNVFLMETFKNEKSFNFPDRFAIFFLFMV